MKLSAVAQLSSIYLLVLVFAFSFNATEYQRVNYHKQVEQLSIVGFSKDFESLRQLGLQLIANQAVKRVKWRRNIDILKDMSSIYHLQSVEDITDLTKLPSSLTFSLYGASIETRGGLGRFLRGEAKADHRMDFDLLYQSVPDMQIYSPEDEYSHFSMMLRANSIIEDVFIISFGLILFFTAVSLRRVYYSKENAHWAMYKKIGGKRSRWLAIIPESVIFVLLPALLIKGTIFIIERYLLTPMFFPWRLWVVVVGLLIISSVVGWLYAIISWTRSV